MEDPQTRKGFKKLYGEPVQVSIYTKWEPKDIEAETPEFIPVQASEVKAWMHPLTDDEVWDVEAVGVEAYRLFKAKGADLKDALWKSDRVEKCQQIFYSIRCGKDRESKKLFETEGELTRLFVREISRLIDIYTETFIPSGEEIKNCLRERLGLGLETESSFPKSSTMEALSSPTA